MFSLRVFLVWMLCLTCLRAGEVLHVVTLHPLLEEMVSRIAGESVEVSCLLPVTENVHEFDPTPSQMAKTQQADLVVAMGKHLEIYLDKLQDNLPEGVEIYEAGRKIPSVQIDPNLAVFACCPTHIHGAIDPHWWHSPMSVRRAARHLGRRLEELVPEKKKEFRKETEALMDELEELHEWAEKELKRIPKSDRKLVTSHAAFGYFCKEYGFVAIPVKGLTDKQNPSPKDLAESIETLKREKIRVVFPENKSSTETLETLQKETGVTLAEPLIADFLPPNGETYAEMFKANVLNIQTSLSKE